MCIFTFREASISLYKCYFNTKVNTPHTTLTTYNIVLFLGFFFIIFYTVVIVVYSVRYLQNDFKNFTSVAPMIMFN